jgi:hypothetical protein
MSWCRMSGGRWPSRQLGLEDFSTGGATRAEGPRGKGPWAVVLPAWRSTQEGDGGRGGEEVVARGLECP